MPDSHGPDAETQRGQQLASTTGDSPRFPSSLGDYGPRAGTAPQNFLDLLDRWFIRATQSPQATMLHLLLVVGILGLPILGLSYLPTVVANVSSAVNIPKSILWLATTGTGAGIVVPLARWALRTHRKKQASSVAPTDDAGVVDELPRTGETQP